MGQCPRELGEGGIDACLHVDEPVLTPQSVDNVGARNKLASAFDEQKEEVHRLPFESDGTPTAAQLVANDVELEVAKAERLARIGCRHCRWEERPNVP